MTLTITRDGMNVPILVDRERPIHINKNHAQTMCGKIIVLPSMHMSWYVEAKVLDTICTECQEEKMSRISILSEPQEEPESVFYTVGGATYHRRPHGGKELLQMALEDALTANLRACKICYPEQY